MTRHQQLVAAAWGLIEELEEHDFVAQSGEGGDYYAKDCAFGQLKALLTQTPARCIKITVKGGCVQNVEDLPDGWAYELNDLDNH